MRGVVIALFVLYLVAAATGSRCTVARVTLLRDPDGDSLELLPSQRGAEFIDSTGEATARMRISANVTSHVVTRNPREYSKSAQVINGSIYDLFIYKFGIEIARVTVDPTVSQPIFSFHPESSLWHNYAAAEICAPLNTLFLYPYECAEMPVIRCTSNKNPFRKPEEYMNRLVPTTTLFSTSDTRGALITASGAFSFRETKPPTEYSAPGAFVAIIGTLLICVYIVTPRVTLDSVNHDPMFVTLEVLIILTLQASNGLIIASQDADTKMRMWAGYDMPSPVPVLTYLRDACLPIVLPVMHAAIFFGMSSYTDVCRPCAALRRASIAAMLLPQVTIIVAATSTRASYALPSVLISIGVLRVWVQSVAAALGRPRSGVSPWVTALSIAVQLLSVAPAIALSTFYVFVQSLVHDMTIPLELAVVIALVTQVVAMGRALATRRAETEGKEVTKNEIVNTMQLLTSFIVFVLVWMVNTYFNDSVGQIIEKYGRYFFVLVSAIFSMTEGILHSAYVRLLGHASLKVHAHLVGLAEQMMKSMGQAVIFQVLIQLFPTTSNDAWTLNSINIVVFLVTMANAVYFIRKEHVWY